MIRHRNRGSSPTGEPPPTGETRRVPPRRLRREQRTVEVMIRLYCDAHHSQPGPGAVDGDMCAGCAALLAYSDERVVKCRFGAQKPVCAKCTVHCYRPQMREQIRAVMRYSGPRMLKRHPYLAIRHLLDRRQVPEG